MTVCLAFLGLWFLMLSGQKTPIGHMLHQVMVIWPASRMNFSKRQVIALSALTTLIGALIWFEAGEALRLLGMASPEILGWITILEVGSFADLLAFAALSLPSWRGLFKHSRLFGQKAATTLLRRS